MKLSIIIPVLNSHEIVRRQLLYLERVGLPDGVELILVDDGSDPPIINTSSLPVTIYCTNDKRAWTWALARNYGARFSDGDKLLMYDLDHIATRELIDFVVATDAPKIHFRRQIAVLDEDGRLVQSRSVLIEQYGLLPSREVKLESHHNSFAMDRELFWKLGGYREDLIGRDYPAGEDSAFYKRTQEYMQEHGIPECCGPTLYVFPSGRWCGDVDHNPQNLFHNLSRKSRRNYWWKVQQRGGLK